MVRQSSHEPERGEVEREPSRSTNLVLPIFAVACSIIAVLILLSSGFGTRLDVWNFRTGFSVFKVAAYSGIGCAVLAILTGIASARRRHLSGVALSALALVGALVAFGIPYSWSLKAKHYPRIHDISTDLDHPPQFVAILPLRPGPVQYPGSAVAAMQLEAYPDLKTLVLPVGKEQAFNSALEAAREMGWRIVAAVPAEGRIEAIDTTPWFGFKDDIVVRVVAAGERSLVDVRSVSRVGISDVGTNARRIRAFLAKMSHR